jgi:F0F1-type ATP synthase epsilon subunit
MVVQNGHAPIMTALVPDIFDIRLMLKAVSKAHLVLVDGFSKIKTIFFPTSPSSNDFDYSK